MKRRRTMAKLGKNPDPQMYFLAPSAPFCG
jgi:hypothetical protein